MHKAPNATAVPQSRTRGFSLVELLIAMVLGLMLTLGMYSVFSSNQRSAELNAAISNLQENARFALDSISRDVRMAGFQGCAPISGGSVQVIANEAPITDKTKGLAGTALWGSKIETTTLWDPLPPWGTGSDGFSVPAVNPGIPGTHALGLQFGSQQTYELETAVGGSGSPDPSGLIFLKGQSGVDVDDISPGDLAIISDCLDGDLFRVTSVAASGAKVTALGHAANSTGNITGTLGTAYGKSALQLPQVMVMRFNARVYYVGDTGEIDEQGNPVTALYQQDAPFDGSNPAVEIVQGVEQFIVTFEVSDSSGQRSTITTGDASFSPENVTAVRIGLLMASEDPIAEVDDDTTYILASVEVPPASSALAGQPSHAGDQRFRVAFNTTVKVRNFRETGN